MSDDPVPVVGIITFNDKPVPISPDPMPVIYFEMAPSFSHMNGVIGITLAVTGTMPRGGANADTCASVAAFLKCSIPAAMGLREAISGALLLAQPVQQGDGGKAN